MLFKLNKNDFFFIKGISLFNVRFFWQSRYLLFNWAYSTNHKRISINYFWFVLFAGVVGMVLATIIRLEMAYPGVGILAGDNAQYLSIVTAHGVIMVFFMAMPMLFGFFGNFLLPTQMGVHDVAFPRMNSAAFWFLPASLLALCQLVCIDRRYQRMNCFNIRELQSLLRNKFFYETTPLNLATNSDKYYQTSNILNFTTNKNTLNSTTEHHFGINKHIFEPLNFFNFETFQKKLFFSNMFKNHKPVSFMSYTKNKLNRLQLEFNFEYNAIFFSFYEDFKIFFDLSWLLEINSLFWDYGHVLKKKNTIEGIKTIAPNFTINNITNTANNNNLLNFKDNSFDVRDVQHNNPTLIYKIKIGNFLPEPLYQTNYSNLINTSLKKSIFGIKSDWYQTNNLSDVFNLTSNTAKTNTLTFYSNLIRDNNSNIKVRHYTETLTLTSLFFTQAKQTRILNNWRALKLNREGWRCRMLSARHQRSLYRRYVNENEIIWVVEKNAKDLLPGWAMITPFSSRTRYTLVGKTDIGIAIVTVTLIASMISSANFLMTYRYLSSLNNRKMRDARSFFSEAVIAASWMMIAANPMLILGLLMLLSDRHWKTSFFDYSGGGDTILFQHMFWFFGHPEVYIIIIPCFGITNTLFSFYLRKRISARASLMYSLYTIAFLGFFVWGHHMYMVGLAHTTRMLYSTLTVMISVPAATKIMHWLVTFINSSVHFELPLILTLFFVFYFISGGISGMAVAHTGMDVIFHDTFYVIGHFHVMLAGSLMFAGFAAFYFYLPSLFGVRYSRTFAYLHVFYYSIGQIFTVIPMIWLGYLGMPRRVLDYPNALGSWHSLTSSAHMITVSGILAFVIMVFDSLRKQKSYTIKTFGVGRYNTRLNFYLYQISRNKYWLNKHAALLSVRPVQHIKNTQNVKNLEYQESTLYFYSFKKRNFGKNWLYL